MSSKSKEPSHKRVMQWFKEGVKGDIESRIKYTNYWKNVWNKVSYEPGSTMMHEKDYETMNCCLCGKEMGSIHATHNPYPLAPHTLAKEAQVKGLPHRCCSECNATLVCPARLKKTGGSTGMVPIFDIWTTDAYEGLGLTDTYKDMGGKGFG